MKPKTKAWLYGSSAILIVLAINLIVLLILDFPLMAVNIIKTYSILLFFLIGGFGLQIGLFTYYNSLNAIGCGTTVASGGISGTSMILCCSHYLLNLAPFLGALVGISALTTLTQYTPYFLWIGIISNAGGIGVIYYQREKYHKKHKH
ncbi:MAG: hypothetical protein ACE5ES_03740 [Candidatus Nanoarchaeia archaeon]